ncbi:transporter substrate-binding domain-containing protein [Chitinimonas koreensis]|uniref:transporter substrate-binding domain-containing protein n=1 Tax=Chitinimonas koreensis TaxID=356302 RepID=UPI00048F1A63|nr:transporter substrate-binding domain-containing protein [Chitinimonas koreensis]QNM94668.1 transporter substrate-binding domain-containing protein [Chitinimonas koreensis]
MKCLRLILPFALLLGLGAVQAEELHIAVEGKYPPFSEIDAKGNLKGFDIDIANALCKEMKVQCKLVQVDWDDIIPALDGKIDGKKVDASIAMMSITEERKKLVDFTDRYANTPAFFFAKARRVPYVFITPRRVEKMKIGVQVETTYDRYVSAKYAATSPIVRYKGADEMYAALAKGEVDMVMDDVVAGYYGFLQTPSGKGFELVGSAVVDPKFFGEGQGIAIRKGNTGLRDRFNRALAVILDNGVYQEIQRKYFIFNIY